MVIENLYNNQNCYIPIYKYISKFEFISVETYISVIYNFTNRLKLIKMFT